MCTQIIQRIRNTSFQIEPNLSVSLRVAVVWLLLMYPPEGTGLRVHDMYESRGGAVHSLLQSFYRNLKGVGLCVI